MLGIKNDKKTDLLTPKNVWDCKNCKNTNTNENIICKNCGALKTHDFSEFETKNEPTLNKKSMPHPLLSRSIKFCYIILLISFFVFIHILIADNKGKVEVLSKKWQRILQISEFKPVSKQTGSKSGHWKQIKKLSIGGSTDTPTWPEFTPQISEPAEFGDIKVSNKTEEYSVCLKNIESDHKYFLKTIKSAPISYEQFIKMSIGSRWTVSFIPLLGGIKDIKLEHPEI